MIYCNSNCWRSIALHVCPMSFLSQISEIAKAHSHKLEIMHAAANYSTYYINLCLCFQRKYAFLNLCKSILHCAK